MRLLNAKSFISFRLLLIAAAAFVFTALGGTASLAEHIFTVESIVDVNDNGTPDPNDDTVTVTHKVTNNNAKLSIDQYVMPFGVEHNDINVPNLPQGWTYRIDPNEVVFNSNGSYIDPNQTIEFTVKSNTTTTGNLMAEAYSCPEAFQPVIAAVPSVKTLSADLNNDGIVNLVDFAVMGNQMGMRGSDGVVDTHYSETVNGIKVVSDVFYDPDLDWNVFDYKVYNNSGDTLFQVKFSGEDWQAGYGQNQPWQTELFNSPISNEDFIRFYDNNIADSGQEEFITGSSLTDRWGIREMEFKSLEGSTFYLKGLAPMEPVKLIGDINNNGKGDGVVDVLDLGELCTQWLSEEIWHQNQN